MKKILKSIHQDDDLHYKKMGLTKDKVEIWEDGLRTDGSKGNYEWWYSDFSFEDGTKCKELKGTKFTDQIEEGVETQLKDPESILAHYMRVSSLRNKMGEMVKKANFEVYNPNWRFKYPALLAYNIVNETQSYTVLTNLNANNDYELELISDYKSIVGYVNAKDSKINYILNEKNLVLPSYSTIILEN